MSRAPGGHWHCHQCGTDWHDANAELRRGRPALPPEARRPRTSGPRGQDAPASEAQRRDLDELVDRARVALAPRAYSHVSLERALGLAAGALGALRQRERPATLRRLREAVETAETTAGRAPHRRPQ